MGKVSSMIVTRAIFIDYFFIYAILGWMVESTYCSLFAKPKPHWINRGFLYGPYCPIYGIGALLVLWVLWPLSNYPLLVFGASVVETSVLEYFTSWLLEKLFHTRWWDYSSKRFNLRGRVCLKNSVLFGILGLLLVYTIHPLVQSIVLAIPLPLLVLSVGVLCFGFTMDLMVTIHTLIVRNHLIEKVADDLDTLNDQIKANNQYYVDQLHVLFYSDPRYQQIVERIRSFNARANAQIMHHIHHAYPKALVRFDLVKKIKSSIDQIK